MATTNKDERMKEITDRLQAGLEELFNSEKYAEYLRVMSQFHHYSFSNTLLIAMQKPDATLVAGYHAWEKKFNRHVMKGEKGIQIIAPAPFKEKQEQEKVDPNTGEVVLREDGQPEIEEVTIVVPRFKVSTVFDLSQTDGDPLPELGPSELTASVENYEIFLNAIRSVAPVPIRFDEIRSGAKGYYDNANKEIVIQAGMSEMQTMKTAVHETAHAILHDRDVMQEQGIQKDQMTKEVEAESVAFASLAHFELDTSDYSFPYIAGWSSGRDTKELKASLDTIRKTSSEIIDGIEASMREQMVELQANIQHEKPFIDHFYVVEDLEVHGQLAIKEYSSCEKALAAYFALPNTQLKALGIQNTNPLPGSLDFIHCVNGIDTAIMDYSFIEVWNNPEIQGVQAEIENALALHDTEIAYDLPDGFIAVESAENGYAYHFYDLNYNCLENDVLETVVDSEPATSLEGAVRKIGDKLRISFDDWRVTEYQKLMDKINEHEDARSLEALYEEAATTVREPDGLAVGYDAGFITVQRTENGFDYTIFNLKCRPIDGGVLETPDLSLHEAMNEVLYAEGLDGDSTWDANYDTIMIEAGETELEQATKEPAISYFAAENVMFPVMGEYHETDTLAEAVKLFEDDQEGKLTGIGIAIDEGSIPLVQREEGMTKMADLVSDNPIVQQAFEEVKQCLQAGRETEYHPREAQEHEPLVEQRAVGSTPAVQEADLKPEEKHDTPINKTASRKESILNALRERQAQIKEREKQAPEQKNRERKKGEQAL